MSADLERRLAESLHAARLPDAPDTLRAFLVRLPAGAETRPRRRWPLLAWLAPALLGMVAVALAFALLPRSSRPPAAADLRAVRFADEATGWVGGSRVIYATADAGASWRVAWTGLENVVSLRSWDRLRVWALIAPQNDLAPYADHLLRSDDGGVTWVTFPLDAPLIDLQLTGAAEAWAVVATDPRTPEGVVHTTDGGRTWTAVPAAGKPQALCATPNGLLWTATAGWVSLSSDTGRSWTRIDSGLPKTDLLAKLGCAADAVWLLVSAGAASNQEAYVVTRSLDRGATWRAVYGETYFPLAPPGVTELDSYSGPFAIVTPDAARFIGTCPACSSSGSASLTRTEDAGATSAKTSLPATPFEFWFDLSFPDPLHGWIVAGHPGSELLKTTDGGASWQPVWPVASSAPQSTATPALPTPPPAEHTSTWTRATLPVPPTQGKPVGGSGGGVSALPDGGFVDFVVDGPELTYVYTSSDGQTWTERGTVTGFDALGITGPVASNGRVYVALGAEQGGVNYGPQSNGAAWVSSDLVHWTKAPTQSAFGGAGFNGIAGSAVGFVAIGFDQGGQAVWFSADGLHWTAETDARLFPPPDTEPTGILHLATGFVMVGRIADHAAVWTSTDGRSWALHSPLPGGSGVVLTGLAEGRVGLVTLGVGGTQVQLAPDDIRSAVAPWISSDGVTWHVQAASPALFGATARIVAAPGGYVAAGTVGLDPGVHLWTSIDGAHWVPVAGVDLTSGGSAEELVSDGRHVLLLGQDASGGALVLVSAGVQR